MAPLGGDPQAIIRRLDAEPDVTAARALVLMLGEFSDAQLPVAQRQPLIEKLLATFEHEPDSRAARRGPMAVAELGTTSAVASRHGKTPRKGSGVRRPDRPATRDGGSSTRRAKPS